MDVAPRKVLIADDEHLIADTLSLIFSTNGYQARAVYSAEQAAEIIAEESPNLIIIDVILPGMNGIDLAALLVTQFPDCRVLLISGLEANAELLTEAVTRGHTFEILAKPVPPNELLDVARRILTTAKPDESSS